MKTINNSSFKRHLRSTSGNGYLPLNNRPILRILLSGLIASFTMYGFFYTLPAFGLHRINIVGELSTVSSDDFIWAAPIQYMALSVVIFPILFAKLFYDNIPGKTPWQKGLSWGLILWTLRGLIVLPVMGQGLFSFGSGHAFESMFLTLMGHALYGIVLGSLIGDQSVVSSYRQRKTKNTVTMAASRR